MATRIRAIRAYRPEFEQGPTFNTKEVAELMARRTNLDLGEVLQFAHELCGVLVHAHRLGAAVKIDGLGTFTPTLRKGRVETVFRAEPALKQLLNDPKNLRVAIRNQESLGKSAEELIARWNAEHPEDPVV
jgi:hypothetical protein